MSIQNKSGTFYLVCDRCGTVEEGPVFDCFMDAVYGKKELGFKSRKDEYGEWEDLCKDCKEEQ